MDMMFELDYETRSFRPTIEWMAQRYEEANQKLFNGILGDCNFDLFTTGSGSYGNTNGTFQAMRCHYVDRYTHRMYTFINGGKIYINRENFYKLCSPKISLNGNKSGSEWAFMVTLVHEMCHYYNYSSGFAPAQHHGIDFMEIANFVTRKTNGQIEVTKKTTLERSQHFVLDDKYRKANEKRMANRKMNCNILVVYKVNSVRLILTTSEKVVHETYNKQSNQVDTIKIFKSQDSNLLEFLMSKGYKTFIRVSGRYWEIKNQQDILNAIDEADGKNIYENTLLTNKLPKTNRPTQTLSINPTQQPLVNRPKMIFSIKTNNGIFETSCNSFAELREKLQNRFPKMNYDTITKLMNNRANFKKIEENKMDVKTIIESVINEFMENEFMGANNNDDAIEVTPDMNLSEFSPLEIA